MNLSISFPATALCFLFVSGSLTADPLDEQMTFVPWTGGNWKSDWLGVPQRTYFYQWTTDMVTWHYAPFMAFGTGGHEYFMASSPSKVFVRLHRHDDSSVTTLQQAQDADFDGDGLSNLSEVIDYNTFPLLWDTDGDGLGDDWEIANSLDPRDDGSINTNNGADGDPDDDGMENINEYWFGGNPHLSDTDGDGLEDGDELYIYSTNVTDADGDGDGLNDYIELMTYGTNPNRWDSDKDTLSDGEELLVYSTNPLKIDSDGDWMWDDWEVDHGLDPTDAADGLLDADTDGLANQLEFVFRDMGYNPFVADSAGFPWSADPDYDGLTTAQEFTIHLTNPRQPDTDRDKMEDGWEIQFGFNANIHNSSDANPNNDAGADPDGDNLTNEQESGYGTNPNDPDTDGDGVNDDVEINQGTNPNDPNDHDPPPAGTVAVSVKFGDHSQSHSEKYRLFLLPLEGDTQERKRTNRDYGQTQTDTFQLPKGSKYTVQFKWVATDPEYRDEPNPDFDYTLEFVDSYDAHLVVKDDDHIIGVNDDSEVFYAENKEATLHVPSFEWITPKGSPVTAADDMGEGKNEFYYDSSANAELLLNLRILVKPTGTAGLTGHDGVKFADRCAFDLPEIAGSTFAWSTDNDDGKAKAEGEHLVAEATYTTLPEQNSSFGLKQAEFTCDDDEESIAAGDFEVFFPKNATNHPGGQAGSPNWFHFWKQFLPMGRIGTLTYDNSIGAYGVTQSQLRTSKVSQAASETNNETGNQGLHAFYETLVHESYHITLWERWWGVEGTPNVPDGSDTDGDTYPNEFETSAIGIIYGFDENDINDLFNPNGDSAGTQYEEDECREQEHLIPDVTAYDAQDWSFDLTTKGKNQKQ